MAKFTKLLPFALVASIGVGAAFYGGTEKLEALKEDKKIESEENDVTFDDISVTYYNYIGAIADEIYNLTEKRDIVGDYALYVTMLNNGLISRGIFKYSHTLYEDTRLMGLNIAMGEGVCINEACNMCDVFSSLGYEAKVVFGKFYKKGETKPDEVNHAVVYVSDGKFAYILDPTNDTILLRKSLGLYVTVESQEDKVLYFEPDYMYSNDYYGEHYNLQLLGDLFNDHKKHWEVLKAYRNYKEAAKQYLGEIEIYERNVLEYYEEEINDYILHAYANKEVKRIVLTPERN